MLRITRRDFLKYCSVAAGALGLSAGTMMKLDNALAKTVANDGLPVVWISGAACTGCTVSLANSRFYTTVDDVLFNYIDLRYLDTLMATAGAQVNGVQVEEANSVRYAQTTYTTLPYVLAVEGGIPAGVPVGGARGEFCKIGELVPGDTNSTMLNVTRKFAGHSNCLAVLAIGTCSSFGGIPGAKGNPTDCRGLLYRGTDKRKGALNDSVLEGYGGVTNATLATKPVINISGCPPHPDWIVGTIAHVIDTMGSSIQNVLAGDYTAVLNALPSLTNYNRPADYGYKQYQCNAGPCPWRYNNSATRANNNNNSLIDEPDYNSRYPQGDSRALGRNKWKGQDQGCLGILGCKGRKTKADCSRRRWNTDIAEQYGVSWCVGSRGGCQGCTEPTFPDKVGKFYTFA
jgi:hydrogenase small subunit